VIVKELAPSVFSYLRRLDDITDEEIRDSLNPEKNLSAIFKAGESQGKSGSFFFFSGDKRFIIKTMTDSDMSAFKKIFRSYVSHVSKNQDSLLARIYGVYTITMQDMEPINVILMANTKRTYDDSTTLLYIFDLKGSLVNRETKAKKGRELSNKSCLKDWNLLKLKQNEKFLLLSVEDQLKILDILEEDTKLLMGKQIMDYSLLLAIESNKLIKGFEYQPSIPHRYTQLRARKSREDSNNWQT